MRKPAHRDTRTTTWRLWNDSLCSDARANALTVRLAKKPVIGRGVARKGSSWFPGWTMFKKWGERVWIGYLSIALILWGGFF